jgi:predicted RecB family nuclease
MRLENTTLTFSATDLANFSACAQRTLLDRLRAHGRAQPEHGGPDPRLELLKQRGLEHEKAYLEQRRAEGQQVIEFEGLSKEERNSKGFARRAVETESAMRAGPDVIYQGVLYDGAWLGTADFLVRVERPSTLGAWSYEVIDAKLTREAKASAVLQTCVYSELLERIQGVAPQHIHLFLGGSPPRLATYRLAHYAAYYRALKRRLLEHLGVSGANGAADGGSGSAALDTTIADPPVAPDPVALCQVCDWRSRCRREREEVDHLSLVAGITRDQRRALTGVRVETMRALGSHPLDTPPASLGLPAYQRIREQARLQVQGREGDVPLHEILPLDATADGRPPLGLGALSAPSPHDLFFDIEGADYAYESGLEYLWGITDVRDEYRCTWALTPDEEKAALLSFLDEATAHAEGHPDARIYHYGHYEVTALKRLVGRYGVRTEELDQLLKRQVFVDLHRIVKQSVRASVDSYSIKAMEAHYAFTREVPLGDAGPARARVEYALAMGTADVIEMIKAHTSSAADPTQRALQQAGARAKGASADQLTFDADLAATGAEPSDADIVAGYNKDDCVSLRVLRDWLEVLRTQLEQREGRAIPRPTPPIPKPDEEEEASRREVKELMDRLLDGVPEDRAARTDAQHVRWLAAHLLEWHRREDKSAWWDFFRLRDLSVEELIQETKPLAGLEYEGQVGTEKQSILHRFTFPEQMHRLDKGDKGIDPHKTNTNAEGRESNPRREVFEIDELQRFVDLKVWKKDTAFDPSALTALIPDEIVQSSTPPAACWMERMRWPRGAPHRSHSCRGWVPASSAESRYRLSQGMSRGWTAPAAPCWRCATESSRSRDRPAPGRRIAAPA